MRVTFDLDAEYCNLLEKYAAQDSVSPDMLAQQMVEDNLQGYVTADLHPGLTDFELVHILRTQTQNREQQ